MELYYLADPHDRHRLSRTGDIEAANDCQPWYFLSHNAALKHPAFCNGLNGLEVKSVPAAETIPGAGVEATFATAADTYRAVELVTDAADHFRIAAAVHSICAGHQ